jgi:hypothetical protein
MRTAIVAGLMSLPFMGGAALAGPTNLLSDGSFESASGTAGGLGTFPSWTVGGTFGSGPGQGPQVIVYGPNATAYGDNVPVDPFTDSPDASGNQAAFFVDDAAHETLSQSIAVTGGTTYEVGFDFFETLSGAANPNAFTLSAILDGTTLATITSGTQYGSGTWYHVFEVFTPTASSANSQFVFDYLSGATAAKDVIVDDVYVEVAPPGDIPEPTSIAALGIGLLGLGWARQRRAI